MLIYTHETVKCHLDIVVSIPLILGVVLAYLILVGRHLVMQRLEILKVQFLQTIKRNSNTSATSITSMDSTDLTQSEKALYDSGSEEDEEPLQEQAIKQELHSFQSTENIMNDIVNDIVNDIGSDVKSMENVQNVQRGGMQRDAYRNDSNCKSETQNVSFQEVTKTGECQGNNQKEEMEAGCKGEVAGETEKREAQSEKIQGTKRVKKMVQPLSAKSLLLFKTISKPWFLLVLICCYVLIYHVVMWSIYFSINVNAEQEGVDFVKRCAVVKYWYSFFLAGSMTLYIGILFVLLLLNGLAFKEEIAKCRWKMVFIDNDPFLFSLTSSLLFIFMVMCAIVMSTLAALRVDLESFYGRIPTNLLWASPTTWIVCGIPVIYAIIQDYKLSLIERQAQSRKQEAEIEKKNGEKLRTFIDFQIDADGVRSIMRHKDTSKLFEKFSMKEYSVENVLLYKRIQKFQSYCRKKRDSKAKKLAIQIYNTFVRSGSPMEANITSYCRCDIKKFIDQLNKKEIKSFPRDIFDQCECEITANLCDTYRRFFAWSEFRDFIQSKIVNHV